MGKDEYYTAPSQEIFEDIKTQSLLLWDIVDTDNDKFGYASEKKNRIKDLENIQDNALYMVSMFDPSNQRTLLAMLDQEESRKFVGKYIFQLYQDFI